MASFTFNASANHFSRLIDAICGSKNYEHNSEAGETRQQFTKRKIREWLISQVRRWEQSEAQKAVISNLTDIEVT
jgi:hypothetical protein